LKDNDFEKENLKKDIVIADQMVRTKNNETVRRVLYYSLSK